MANLLPSARQLDLRTHDLEFVFVRWHWALKSYVIVLDSVVENASTGARQAAVWWCSWCICTSCFCVGENGNKKICVG